jgi:Tfp pilus assembly protein PilF
MMPRILIAAAVLSTLCACSSEPVRELQSRVQGLFQPAKGQAALSAGMRQYENGEYPASAKSLRTALKQGLSDKDSATAYKYLGFIDCASNRERQCRDEFRKALAADPSLELGPAEAGHPVWGPVFRSVKAGR